ncbi:hypothetical protein CA85_03650 [Allorhodopirellula solitaria]|uniref:Uncharacterized protein n=1 Tax=Allorhodopirellula solitaria TaxID=2527987 RepID=A0A5C5YJS6_9BACT|nr:hypothetical protein CA85_03650 [Allorhodopirellula solitaria]
MPQKTFRCALRTLPSDEPGFSSGRGDESCGVGLVASSTTTEIDRTLLSWFEATGNPVKCVSGGSPRFTTTIDPDGRSPRPGLKTAVARL